MWSYFARARAACASFIIGAMLAMGSLQCAQAQTTVFDVTGTITADDGTPLANASVSLSAPGGARTVESDARGAFTFQGVSGGTYTLTASAPGYQRLSGRTVTVSPGTATLTVVLSPATTNSLTVIGQVRAAAAGETVSTSSAPTVTMDAQSAAAAGTKSVGAMMWNTLSTTPVIPLGGGSNATQTFAVRGPDPTETTVDIDGHPMNNGNTGDFDLSLIDPAALSSVQVIYGISPSSLIGPNTIGGGVNIVTLQPTQTPHSLIRIFGGAYGTFGETLQTTGSADRFGYAVSLHNASSDGSVNQTILAPPAPQAPSDDTVPQNVGSSSYGNSLLAKLRYQLGGPNGYGYLQLNFRNQTVTKDESALLTSFTPPGFSGSGGDDDALHGGKISPNDDDDFPGGFQSFAGTSLAAHQGDYGFDAQLPIGNHLIEGAPADTLLFSHQTSLASQSVDGPGAQTTPYLYNQRDLLNDDWLEFDHRFPNGALSFKYDLGNETLNTNFVQGQVIADGIPGGPLPLPPALSKAGVARPFDAEEPPVETFGLSQTSHSAVLRYTGDPTSHLHVALATYFSDWSTFGTSFDPRAGLVWTPTSSTAVRGTVGTTFQTPQLSELVVPPPADRVPVGGVIFIGNPDLKPDFATDYDIGMEQIFGLGGHPLHLSADWYQTNLRSPASQLNVEPDPGCQTPRHPEACPISTPVNAGNGIYRGVDIRGDLQLARYTHVRAGWDVDSSYLTVIPESIQDGTLVANEQSLGQPLHKAYFAVDQEPPEGLAYGARLNYEGGYNELNRSPYALLEAHLAYRHAGFEFGLYGTNLTNVYAAPFTIVGGGVPYGTVPGNPMITPNAFVLQGATVTFVATRAF